MAWPVSSFFLCIMCTMCAMCFFLFLQISLYFYIFFATFYVSHIFAFLMHYTLPASMLLGADLFLVFFALRENIFNCFNIHTSFFFGLFVRHYGKEGAFVVIFFCFFACFGYLVDALVLSFFFFFVYMFCTRLLVRMCIFFLCVRVCNFIKMGVML